MKRVDEIFSLKRRYHEHMLHRRLKAAGVVYARLRDLVTKQLKAECRASKNAV